MRVGKAPAAREERSGAARARVYTLGNAGRGDARFSKEDRSRWFRRRAELADELTDCRPVSEASAMGWFGSWGFFGGGFLVRVMFLLDTVGLKGVCCC